MKRSNGRNGPGGASVAAALAIAMAVTVAPGAPARAGPVAATDPRSWGCESDHLKSGTDTIQLAPTDVGDRNPDGTPVRMSPDSRGRYVPIVVVHGWTGRDTHTRDRDGAFSHLIDLTSIAGQTVAVPRSLVGQLQRIPGAAVFTFDYRDYAARWVDDSHLGPALGSLVDCLFQATGEKVIIVGHSMGGLVARYAATHPGPGGAADRSGEISSVVTFGTPQTGSLAALLTAGAVDAAGALYKPVALIRLILAACGRLTSNELRTGTLCDTLPAPVRAFDSDAGVALRYGSAQLAALQPFPPSITVDALAGSATFQVPTAGWFSLPWDTTPVDAGDLVVTTDSALHGTALTTKAPCSYQLNPVRGVTDQVGLVLGTVAKSEVAEQPLASFVGACVHTNLMRDIQLTNEATGEIADDIAARQPVTAADLLHAPVPAACKHKAGTLVNGTLPGIPASQGSMSLGWINQSNRMTDLLALGDLNGDGGNDAAAVLDCDAGGVAWPQLVAFYTHGPKLMGSVSLGDINLPGHLPGEHATVRQIRYAGGAVQVSWTTEQNDDPACCGTLDYSATLRWSGRRITASDLRATTEVATAITFLSAVHRKDSATANSLGAPGVAGKAATLAAQYPAAFAATPTCMGQLGNLPTAVFQLVDPGLGAHGNDSNRVCFTSTGTGYIALGLAKSGYRQWQVGWIELV